LQGFNKRQKKEHGKPNQGQGNHQSSAGDRWQINNIFSYTANHH
jgi:hypothetical protein